LVPQMIQIETVAERLGQRAFQTKSSQTIQFKRRAVRLESYAPATARQPGAVHGSGKLTSTRNSEPIRIGLATDEPIRVAGLASIFDQPAEQEHPQLVPVIGSLPELLALANIEYIVVD